MKMEKNMERFIELRIAGNSFDETAKELKVSKQSLIEWNKQMTVRNAIQEGKAIKINSLVKANNFNLENRLTNYLQLAKKINDELLNRDLSEIGTDTLLKMSIANDGRLKGLIDKNIQIGENKDVWECGSKENGFFNLQLDE